MNLCSMFHRPIPDAEDVEIATNTTPKAAVRKRTVSSTYFLRELFLTMF